MTGRRSDISPYGAVCKVELELPWEQAEFIVKHGPSIIKAIKRGVDARKDDLRCREETRNLVDANAEQLKAEYAKIAETAEAEITRRSNRPGQRPQLIKQLAGEYGLPAPTLGTILRVYRREKKRALDAKRSTDIIRLHFLGFSNQEIAKELNINHKTVARILESEGDLVKALRRSLLPEKGGKA